METIAKIKGLMDDNDLNSSIEKVVDEFRLKSFKKNWQQSISEISGEEELRINSIIIGNVDNLPDRIYVGANTNKVFVFDMEGHYLEVIELDEGVEVERLLIGNISIEFGTGNELLVQTDEFVFFYTVNHKKEYQKLSHSISSPTSNISALFSIEVSEEYRPIYIGNTNGEVVRTTYKDVKLGVNEEEILPESARISGEIIAAITGSKILLDGKSGIVVGYKNGVIILLDKDHNVISRHDIDKEIEGIYLIQKDQTIIVTTDDYNIFHFSVSEGQFVNNWSYFVGCTVSAVFTDPRETSAIDFFVLSEDNGTISGFNSEGSLQLLGDPSFEGTSGDFYENKLILASREGHIAQFELVASEKSDEWRRLLFTAYKRICEDTSGNDFYEFFNMEFESDERVSYFKEFLIDYFSATPDESVLTKIKSLFELRKFDTDLAEGVINKITSNSRLKNAMLEKFKDSALANELNNYEARVKTSREETNFLKRAEGFIKKDVYKYIELMSEIRIHKLDKIWVNRMFEDDDVVAIDYFHDPSDFSQSQVLVGTRKGNVHLIDKLSGQVIWSFNLDKKDGKITNIEVADICNNGIWEIIIGLENSENSVIIICTDKDKFNSANNEINLKWANAHPQSGSFKLYLTRCRVSGLDLNTVHTVRTFDFDSDGVHDLIISSIDGKFDIFYFADNKRDRILPRPRSFETDNNDDVLVFELLRDKDGGIILYTGSATGNIDKYHYQGKGFVRSGQSFTERDAQITDIFITKIDGEKLVLFSSEDNFIYCLNDNLEYKWAFKTGGDVRSLSVSEFDGHRLIFAISKDGNLYALDGNGNKKWDYNFKSPLDKFLVTGDEIIVADSDGYLYLMNLRHTGNVIAKMDEDLAGVPIDLLQLLEFPDTQGEYMKPENLRIFAIRKLLAGDPDEHVLNLIAKRIDDNVEFQELVRCETVRLLTAYLQNKNAMSKEVGNALLSTLTESSREVRLESVKSLFKLINKHKHNKVNIGSYLKKIAEDEDVWVKEYFVGALFKKHEDEDEDIYTAKWKALLKLIDLNKDEEWVLNEAISTIVNFIYRISNLDYFIEILHQLFSHSLQEETLERIRNKVTSRRLEANVENSNHISNIFNMFFQILVADNAAIIDSLNEVVSQTGNDLASFEKLQQLLNKLKAFKNIAEQISVDDIIDDKLIDQFSTCMSTDKFSLSSVVNNLSEYSKENNISDKIVYLNYATESIAVLTKNKSSLHNIDKRLFELAIEGHLAELISKASRILLDNVFLDVELENREVILNDSGIADVNLNIINKGYKTVENIEITVKRNAQFEVIDNIGEVGELVRQQHKKVYFKIKPKTIGPIDLFFEITYKGCLKSNLEQQRVYVKEATLKEWTVIPNPYTAGIPIENDDIFVGRESLIQEALTALKKDPVFVMGHRRMGKTSFIKFIQRHYLSGHEFIPIFISAELVNFDSMNSFLFSFCDPIAYELWERQVITEERGEKYLQQIKDNGLVEFGSFFKDILRKVKGLNKTLVLIIDEYPIIHESVELGKVDSQFITNLRGFMQNNSREFKMIYSGASSLKYLKSQYSSNIMGVGKSVEVSFLSEDDVKMLASKPLNDQLQFEDSAFQYFMELTHGQPFLVQVILSYLVDKLNKEKKSSMVFKEAIEEGIRYFLEQAPHLQDDWNNRVYSNDLKWTEDEEVIARAYKQLIITAITDNWRKSKNGLTEPEIFKLLETSLAGEHKMNNPIFEEVVKLLAGNDDVLKKKNGLLFIKVGLFREWAINKMNLLYSKTLLELKGSILN